MNSSTVSYIAETTVIAIVLAWVLTHAEGFNTIVNATGGAAVQSVQSLWARDK